MASTHLHSKAGRWDAWSKWLLLMSTLLPTPKAGDALLESLGFTSGQSPFPQAEHPHLSTHLSPSLPQGGDLSPSSSFPAGTLGAELIPSSEGRAALIAPSWRLTNNPPFSPGQEGGGNHDVWPHHMHLLWAVFPQATTLTATI